MWMTLENIYTHDKKDVKTGGFNVGLAIFGFIYYLVHRRYVDAIVSFIATMILTFIPYSTFLTVIVYNVVLAFFDNKMNTKNLLRKSYAPTNYNDFQYLTDKGLM